MRSAGVVALNSHSQGSPGPPLSPIICAVGDGSMEACMKILVTGGGGRVAAFARSRWLRALPGAPGMDARPDRITMDGSRRPA
jgi:hypothetical protein